MNSGSGERREPAALVFASRFSSELPESCPWQLRGKREPSSTRSPPKKPSQRQQKDRNRSLLLQCQMEPPPPPRSQNSPKIPNSPDPAAAHPLGGHGEAEPSPALKRWIFPREFGGLNNRFCFSSK